MSIFKKNKTELNYLLFEVTRSCNLSCSFCYNHWKREVENLQDAAGEEGYENALRTLKELFKTTTLKHITFTGGEPLLADRLSELALFCRMKGASVSVITNGNAGKTEDFAQLIKIGVKLFELPLHSAEPAVHDRMTGVLGSWRKSLDRMVAISRFGGYVVPAVVITRQNASDVGQTLEFLHRSGFSRIMLNRYNIGGVLAEKPEKILPSFDELNLAFQQANETAGRLRLQLSSNVCTPHCLINPVHYRNIQFTNCAADIRNRPLTLTVSGNLRFCNHSPGVIGNIFREKPDDIFERTSKTTPVLERPAFCAECNLYERCLGGCRAAAQQSGGNFNDIDPVVFIIKKKEQTATA